METETDVPSRTYFLCNVCHVCKSKESRVRCEICKMAAYCSPQHRRQDWYQHSELCRAIYKICSKNNLKHLYERALEMSSLDFRQLRHETAMNCSKILKRALESWEYEFLYHPRLCNVCHDWKDLEECANCRYVYTCRQNHFRKDHPRWCPKLKIYCDVIISECKNNKPKIDLVTSENNHSEVEKAVLSEMLTYPLTVLHAVRELEIDKEVLTIYMVGAEVQAEVQPIGKWEVHLMHSLSQLRVLNLVFIGPELRWDSERMQIDLCDRCREQNRRLKIEFIAGKFYHEFVRSKKSVPDADLICAFNSGMYRPIGFSNQDSWRETISELFVPGRAPVLVTEYTCHELELDFKSIKNQCPGVRTHDGPAQNQFASLKPGLNIISEDEAPVIFKNYYYAIMSASVRDAND